MGLDSVVCDGFVIAVLGHIFARPCALQQLIFLSSPSSPREAELLLQLHVGGLVLAASMALVAFVLLRGPRLETTWRSWWLWHGWTGLVARWQTSIGEEAGLGRPRAATACRSDACV